MKIDNKQEKRETREHAIMKKEAMNELRGSTLDTHE